MQTPLESWLVAPAPEAAPTSMNVRSPVSTSWLLNRLFGALQSVSCNGGTVNLHPDGFIVSNLYGDVKQDWATACEMLDASERLLPGQRTCTMVLVNKSSATRDGRRAFEEVGEHLIERVAMVITSKVGEMTGNFFLRINQPPYPMRLFTDPLAAAEWLAPHTGSELAPEGAAVLEKLRAGELKPQ